MRIDTEEYQERKQKVIQLLKLKGYSFKKYSPALGLLMATKHGIKVNIYLTKMTITTELFHPEKGKTQLHRKNVTLELLNELLDNPRLHTGKGYYRKYN